MHERSDKFLRHAPYAYDVMMEARPPPHAKDLCTACLRRSGKETLLKDFAQRYRCEDCIPEPDLCDDCVKEVHLFAPFHRLWRWHASARTWVKMSMGDLDGHAFYLGHGGAPCKQPTSLEPSEVVMVHEHGVTTMKVHYCGCRCPIAEWTPQQYHPYQLLQYGLFPASWDKPRTVFTLPLLRSFDLLVLQTKASILDLYNYLRRCTDSVDIHGVKVGLTYARMSH